MSKSKSFFDMSLREIGHKAVDVAGKGIALANQEINNGAKIARTQINKGLVKALAKTMTEDDAAVISKTVHEDAERERLDRAYKAEVAELRKKYQH